METPTRRSKRFQPATPSTSVHLEGQNHTWVGKPTHKRPSSHDDLQEDDTIDDLSKAETQFYKTFTRQTHVPSGRGRRKSANDEEKTAVFEVGDTVLVSVDTPNKPPGIAVIVSMWHVGGKGRGLSCEEPMKVRIHWFLRPRQMASVRAHRDHLPNEIYYSLTATAIITPHEILEHCSVTSQSPDDAKSKSRGKSRASGTHDPKTGEFYCHLAINAQRGLFYELDWEMHRESALEADDDDSVSAWNVEAVDPRSSRGMRKGKARDKRTLTSSEDEEDEEESAIAESEQESEPEEEEPEVPITPSRKRQATTQTTPRRSKRTKRTLAELTPHSKAALRQRARRAKTATVRPIPELAYKSNAGDMKESLPKDPWLRAMRVLHVGSRPDALPCRDEEFNHTLKVVEGLLEEGSGGCVYISGVPGTGKTATVHAMVRELKRMAERNEINPFTYVEINGLKIPEPAAAYGLLWEAVSGHDSAIEGPLRISSKEALKQLTTHFARSVNSGPESHACVVLMDELDQLMTTKQDVVYNFFNWPTLVASKLIVLAVANTHDLPERVMSGRVRSRLGMARINFKPYTTVQLEKIVNARLQTAALGDKKSGSKGNDGPTSVIAPDGIKFAAMKVSSISGDARRVLDICRRAVELVQPGARVARADDVKEVIKLMQNSPTAAFLQNCSLHERIMLAALLKCTRRDGVEDVRWADVQHQHIRYTNILVGDADSTHKPTLTELDFVLDSLLASYAMLIEEGAVAAKKAPGDRRVLLNIESTEVERVLGEMGGPRWENALAV